MALRVSARESGNSPITFIGFNQDSSCFAVGLQNGFRIYNTDPLKLMESVEYGLSGGTGIGYIEMLFRSNFLGILGGGRNPKINATNVCMWSGIEQNTVLELGYDQQVYGIKLRKDLIIVVLEKEVRIYNFSKLPDFICTLETFPNPLGLCQVSHAPENPFIAFPGLRKGEVTLLTLPQLGSNSAVTTKPPPRHIFAHQHDLVAMVMSNDGELLATASDQGTLVHVFSTRTCAHLCELRRGTTTATVTCLAFSPVPEASSGGPKERRLAVASDHGTIHIFYLKLSETGSGAMVTQEGSRQGSQVGRSTELVAERSSSKEKSASLLSRYLFSIVSSVRIPLETSLKAICSFGDSDPDTLIVVAADGSYWKYRYTQNSAITKEQMVNILDHYDDDY